MSLEPKNKPREPDGSAAGEADALGHSSGVVGEILAEAQQVRDERRERSERAQERVEKRLSKKRSSARTLYYLVPVLLLLSAGNLFLARQAVQPFSAQEQSDASRMMLYLVAAGIEEHREINGRLPSSLNQIDAAETGLRYEPSGQTYTLSIDTPNGPIVYEGAPGTAPLIATLSELTGQPIAP
jgi:hypothetical protein